MHSAPVRFVIQVRHPPTDLGHAALVLRFFGNDGMRQKVAKTRRFCCLCQAAVAVATTAAKKPACTQPNPLRAFATFWCISCRPIGALQACVWLPGELHPARYPQKPRFAQFPRLTIETQLFDRLLGVLARRSHSVDDPFPVERSAKGAPRRSCFRG